MIRGAGVILWRERQPLELEVALVHRQRYDDWTFPKGGVELGESPIHTAYRECKEEVGITPVLGPYIGDVTYKLQGEKKRVDYWMAKVGKSDETFAPGDEVDKVSWTSIKEARHFLTYEEDRTLLSRFVKAERHVNTLILLRHAKAVKREEWFGEDSDRPLSHKGQLQAEKLSGFFSIYAVEEIHTSDAQRCLSTVQPIAMKSLSNLKSSPILSEDFYEKDDNAAMEYVMQLIKYNKRMIVCSHNPILDDMLLAFENHKHLRKELPKLAPADCWVIHHIGSRIIALEALPAPIVEKSLESD
jgi:8-oxo-dGTP diphosphatase